MGSVFLNATQSSGKSGFMCPMIFKKALSAEDKEKVG
jgi:hypothetical protein